MGFRADEAAETNLKNAVQRMTQGLEPGQREKAEQMLRAIVAECGPVVESYPVWHPLVNTGGHTRSRFANGGRPSTDHGWKRIDHAVFMRSGFITAPHGGSADVVNAAKALTDLGGAVYNAEVLPKGALYFESATPVVVRVYIALEDDGTIEQRRALRGLLEYAHAFVAHAEVAEPWENLTGILLGYPNGKRSSLLINEATGNAMRKVILALNKAGAFGSETARRGS